MQARVVVGENQDIRNRRNMQTLLMELVTRGYGGVDRAKFRESIENITGSTDLNIEELLEQFVNLNEDDRIKVIKSSGIDLPNCCTVEIPTVNFELPEERDFIKQLDNDDKFEYTESELRKLIKHCKNPMEKQRLQRELSTMNFMGGKHRRGRKR